jgi:hypothetical protein
MLAKSAKENLAPSEAATAAASRAGAETLRSRSRIEPDAAGQARLDQLGPTGDNADQILVPQPGQQLHEYEWPAVRAPGQVEERVVGFGVHHVLGHLGHGGVVEWAEDDPLSAAVLQMPDRSDELRGALVGAEGEDPGNRQVGEANGQRTQRRRCPTVGPLQVVERDQQRSVQSSALEQRLQILQQPVPLLGERVELPEPGSLEQRVRAVEQSVHQRSQLDDPGTRFGCASADPKREPSRDSSRLRQQAGLAHARLSVDEHYRADARAHPVELNTDRREFGVPTAHHGSRSARQAQIGESTSVRHPRSSGLSEWGGERFAR